MEVFPFLFLTVVVVLPLLGGYLGGLFTPSKGSGIGLGFIGTFIGAIGALIAAVIISHPFLNGLPFLTVIISAIAALGGYLGAKTNLRT